MAYMSQEKKKLLTPAIKEALKKYGLKGSLRVHNHSTLILTIKSGKVDFIKSYMEAYKDNEWKTPEWAKINEAPTYINVNPYHFRDHFKGKARAALIEIINGMNKGNHNRSDIMTDYFDVGWYIDVYIGTWENPYILEK